MEEQFEIVRVISSFDKTTERLVDEVKVSISLTLEQLKSIFIPYLDDPLMYDPYSIDATQAMQLHQLDNNITLYTEQFDYQLECFQASS